MYHERTSADFAQIRELASRGGKQSQINQAIARMAGEQPLYPLPKGRLKKTVMVMDHDSGRVIRHDLYENVARIDRYDVVTDFRKVRRKLSATKLSAILRKAWKHVPVIRL